MIYLARDGEFVKIGVAQRSNLYRRWLELQIGNPREIQFRIHRHLGSRKLEKALHQQFETQWVRGEWFRIDATLEAIWESACPVERRPQGKPPIQRQRVMRWLEKQLSQGPMHVSELIKRAENIGVQRGSKSLRRAATVLGVKRSRQKGAPNTHTMWTL